MAYVDYKVTAEAEMCCSEGLALWEKALNKKLSTYTLHYSGKSTGDRSAIQPVCSIIDSKAHAVSLEYFMPLWLH